ncbi:MAG: hypothetical protein QW083_04140 [Methanomassiliicoccales archaeon]
MKNLEEIASQIQYKLDEKDAVREVALKSSRAIIRIAAGIVHAIHKHEDVKNEFTEARDEVHRLRSLLEDHPDIWNARLSLPGHLHRPTLDIPFQIPQVWHLLCGADV